MQKIHFYYIVAALSGVVGVVKLGVYAKLLGPTGLGYYSLSLLLSTYTLSLCSFGFYEGALGVFPIWYGEGRIAEVEIARNKVAGFCLATTSLVLFVLALVWVTFPFEDSKLGLAIFLGGAMAAAMVFFVLVLADLRSQMKTFEFGLIMFLRSGLTMILGATLAYKYGFVIVLIAEIFITLLITYFVATTMITNFGFDFSAFQSLKPLLRIGFPLMLSQVFSYAATSIDNLFVIVAFGAPMFGQYAFAMLVPKGAILIRGIIYQHLGPSILFQFGEGKPIKILLNNLNKMLIAGFFVAVMLWYPFERLMTYLISAHFPEYIEALPLFSILYIGACFIVVAHYESFLVAVQKTEYLLVINIILLLVTCLLFYVALLLKWSISNYAMIFIGARIAYFISTFLLAKNKSTRLLCVGKIENVKTQFSS